MSTSDTDVLIVGAGPTGLTLACELRRRGIDCRLVEKAAEAHHRSRGKGLQPRSLEIFDDLGIAEAALERGRRDNDLRLYVGGRLTAEVRVPARPPAPGVPYPDLLIIPQWCTEQVLRERLESLGGRVELGREVSAVEQDVEGVTATVVPAQGAGAAERVRARYVVACEGGTAPSGTWWGCAWSAPRRPSTSSSATCASTDSSQGSRTPGSTGGTTWPLTR